MSRLVIIASYALFKGRLKCSLIILFRLWMHKLRDPLSLSHAPNWVPKWLNRRRHFTAVLDLDRPPLKWNPRICLRRHFLCPPGHLPCHCQPGAIYTFWNIALPQITHREMAGRLGETRADHSLSGQGYPLYHRGKINSDVRGSV